MNVVHVLLAQEIVEALHARSREHSLQHDVLEGRMQSGIELAQIGSAAGAEHVASRTFLDEFDLAGIDFGMNARGEVLLFEANATMVVNPPEPDEQWAYRRPAVERIYTAVRNMLIARARS